MAFAAKRCFPALFFLFRATSPGFCTAALAGAPGGSFWENLALRANSHHCELCRTSPQSAEKGAPHYHQGPSWRLKLRSVIAAMQESGNFAELLGQGHVYQFGVFSGWTMGLLRRVFGRTCLVGFDSFEGLPEEADGTAGWTPGLFNSGDIRDMLADQLDSVGRCKTRFVKGFFNTSLTIGLKDEMKLQPALYIDIDVDLYISSIQALDFMFASGLVQVGTLISYDDWWVIPCWHNSTNVFDDGETQAHVEIARKYGVRFNCVSGPCKYISEAPGGFFGRCTIHNGWGPIFQVVEIGTDHFDTGFTMSPADISRWEARNYECIEMEQASKNKS
ncbi:unnamed protein product [Polarella glacialis]|uniref:Uncharacterized protein n=1 Tax=Polarella glacialis TaxID=89957 RepID=A0A813E613_POLGL|nr:unnamed protein product [Polarella glacialis]